MTDIIKPLYPIEIFKKIATHLERLGWQKVIEGNILCFIKPTKVDNVSYFISTPNVYSSCNWVYGIRFLSEVDVPLQFIMSLLEGLNFRFESEYACFSFDTAEIIACKPCVMDGFDVSIPLTLLSQEFQAKSRLVQAFGILTLEVIPALESAETYKESEKLVEQFLTYLNNGPTAYH
ncbi:hypothetical protein KC845_00455 [Candidatus Kaiserbacteria bacterium]|nr:hypothetical protein [Candidatus Kaiserbacteria bacterium]